MEDVSKVNDDFDIELEFKFNELLLAPTKLDD